MKKLLSAFLALTMLFSITAGMSSTALADEGAAENITILPGETKTAVIPNHDSEGYVDFYFKPTTTGKYYFYYKDSETDFCVDVYEYDVAEDEYIYMDYYDDNYSDGYNFIVDETTFEAGKTYCFSVESYENEDCSGDFTLSRVKPSDYDDGPDIYITSIDFTFDEPKAGDKLGDFELTTTTIPSGYGKTVGAYWRWYDEEADEYIYDGTFEEGKTYEFKTNGSICDYDNASTFRGTRCYVNGSYAGTAAYFDLDYTVCSHSNTTKGLSPASCTRDGYTDAVICSDCGKQLANGSNVVPKSATIRKSSTTFTYNCKFQRPSITVYDRNGKQLTYKKDFTVDYTDWSSTQPGTYYVIVELIGNYSDVRVYPYTINPTKITPNVKLNRNTITTNGTVQRPSVTVKDEKGNALTYNKDFAVEYSNWSSKDIGRYTVTVVGIGKYEGSFVKTFPYYINPKPTTFLTSAQGGFKAVKNGFTLKWNKQSDITGYQIQYSTRSDFKNAATVYAGPMNSDTKTITGRASKTRYYVRIRTYKNVGGSYFYSDWSTGNKSVVTL